MRSNGFLLIALGSLLVASAVAASISTTLAASASNALISGNKVCGRCQSLAVSDAPSVSSLIKWDLSSLPSDAVISAAYLTIYVTQSGSDIPILTAYTAPMNWNQSLAGAGKLPTQGDLPLTGDPTWEDASYPSVQWATPGAGGGTQLANLPTDTNGLGDAPRVQIDKDVVSGWLSNPSTNTGIVLRLQSTTGTVYFGSHFNGDTTLRPTLDITYESTSGVPPPPTKSVNYAPPPGRGGIGVPTRFATPSSNGAIVGGVIGGIMGVFVIITIATIVLRT